MHNPDNRVRRIELNTAVKCGAGEAVAREIVRRLTAGEKVTYYSASQQEWGAARLVGDPCRARHVDGSDADGPGPAHVALGQDWLSQSGGGFWIGDYALFVNCATGYRLEHYQGAE